MFHSTDCKYMPTTGMLQEKGLKLGRSVVHVDTNIKIKGLK